METLPTFAGINLMDTKLTERSFALKTPHYSVVQRLLRKYFKDQNTFQTEIASFPTEADFVLKVVETVDILGINNFKTFRSSTGASFGYTEISLKSLIQQLYPTARRARFSSPQTLTLVCPGFGSDAFARWDMLLKVIFDQMPHILRSMHSNKILPDMKVVMIGFPHRFGGEVSVEWVKSLQNIGLKAYGKLYAEFVKKKYLHNDIKQLIFQTSSLGGLVSEATVGELRSLKGLSFRIRMYNPAGHKQGIVKSLQAVFGFLIEHYARFFFDSITRHIRARRKNFLYHMSVKLSQAYGYEPISIPQFFLKTACLFFEVLNIVKGQPFNYYQEARYEIKRGVLDPVTSSLKDLWIFFENYDPIKKSAPSYRHKNVGEDLTWQTHGHYGYDISKMLQSARECLECTEKN